MLKRRKLWKVYIVWLFLGLFGGHYFYCYQPEPGFLYLFTLGGFGLAWLTDVFIIPLLVFQTNQMVDQANRLELQRAQRFGNRTIINGAVLPIVRQVLPTEDDGEKDAHMRDDND